MSNEKQTTSVADRDAITSTNAPLPKTYQPAEHEGPIRAKWLASRAFGADPANAKGCGGPREAYAIVIPPPNVTAALHLGHALNNTLQDVLIRAKRMQGYETLWMPGTDHAGIATQTVVDKRLKAAGEPALAEYKKLEAEGKNGREQFIAQVQAWKDEYEEVITGQLVEMGCSCDWDRQRFTMDEQCARAVREAFFQFFKDGLIYRGKRLVNWDPVSQTALADDEVDNIEIDGFFYYMKYPLTAPVTLDDGSTLTHVTVATTRPETYLGDTAVAVNPKDPRAKQLVGKRVRLPIVGRELPIIEDEYVVLEATDPEAPGVDPKAKYASGFLKVTPAHDPNDWDIGVRHREEIETNSSGIVAINVMAPDGSISDQHGWSDVGDAGQFVGLSREEARKAVAAEFKEMGLLKGVKPYRHGVGHSYRSHVPIEPYLSDQWYVKVSDDRLAGAAQRALAREQRSHDGPIYGDSGAASASDGKLRFYPERYAKTYENWHDNLRDWCISRQLWWGHRIPVWVKDFGDEDVEAQEFFEAKIKIFEKEDRVWKAIPEVEIATGTDDARSDRSVTVICVRDDADTEAIALLESNGFMQDPDVLDTWFSSALWPLSTMGWPDETPLLQAFNPTNVLCTAREIITLWVSRMVMFNRYFKGGDLPFRDVYIHAMIQDGDGRKMSKTLGNGVDPLDIIHTKGADAMRFTLCQMTTQTQDVRMPVERDVETGRNTSPKFELGKRFSNKLWNASRFTLMMLADGEDAAQDDGQEELTLADRWMLSRLASSVAQVESSLDGYQYSAYAETMYDLLWRDFCDWYLEAVKPTVRASARQRALLRATLDCIVRLLHPIAPFVTEAIFEKLRIDRDDACEGIGLGASEMLCTAPWPIAPASLRDEEAEQQFGRLRELISTIRDVRERQNVKPKRAITLHVPAALENEINAADGLVETIATLGLVTTETAAGASSNFVFDGHECSLSDLTDEAAVSGSDAERKRLEEKIAELEKSIGVLGGRLANKGYVEKAPKHLVEQSQEQLEALKAECEASKRRLGELG